MSGTRASGISVGRTLPILLAVMGVSLTPQASKADPIIFSSGELDLDIHFEDGSLGIGWHDHDNGIEYGTQDLIVRFVNGSIVGRPVNPNFSFLGVGAGQPVWVLPAVQNPALVYPGIAAEEVEPGLFAGDQLFLQILAVHGPGDFSIWDTDAFGNPIGLAASSNGLPDELTVSVGSHSHFNWALSQAGLYRIDVRAYGYDDDGNLFEVYDTLLLEAEAVPEPASLAVFALMAVGCVAVRRLKKRR